MESWCLQWGQAALQAEQALPAAWEPLLSAACPFFTAVRAQSHLLQVFDSLRFAGGFSLAARGESHPRDGDAGGKDTGPWAVPGVKVSEMLAEHWDVKWWPFPFIVHY